MPISVNIISWPIYQFGPRAESVKMTTISGRNTGFYMKLFGSQLVIKVIVGSNTKSVEKHRSKWFYDYAGLNLSSI